MSGRIALATCSFFPDLDDDEQRLQRALGDRAMPAVWDDPDVDWDAFDLVVVRNTWDYTDRVEDFLAWADARGERLRNPPHVIRWTTDKRYLGELAAAGLPVVPTTFAAPGEPVPALGPEPVVVKPAVGAGSRGAARFEAADAAAAHVRALQAEGHTAMVQPYLHGVDAMGETALMYAGGAFSHAIRKGALLGDDPREDPSGLFVSEDIAPREPSAAERALGDRLSAWLTERLGPLLYARLDLIPGVDGEPVVLEAELAEPSFFFTHAEGAAERLAAAILA